MKVREVIRLLEEHIRRDAELAPSLRSSCIAQCSWPYVIRLLFMLQIQWLDSVRVFVE